jgi:hypothetical protein
MTAITSVSVCHESKSPRVLAQYKKGKVHPVPGNEGPEEEKRYSCTLSLTSVLDAGGKLMPRPDSFTSGEGNRYPLDGP